VLSKRLPWLVALLLLQSFSAAILHAFDELLAKHIVIAVFIPMLVGTGGNAGNQPGNSPPTIVILFRTVFHC
jgi:magnesium transporter